MVAARQDVGKETSSWIARTTGHDMAILLRHIFIRLQVW